MARRLSRARQKIAVARNPYRVPSAEQLPDRVAGVLATVHLLFTEGYSATGPGQALHGERAAEALRLARLLRRLLPEDAGLAGCSRSCSFTAPAGPRGPTRTAG